MKMRKSAFWRLGPFEFHQWCDFRVLIVSIGARRIVMRMA